MILFALFDIWGPYIYNTNIIFMKYKEYGKNKLIKKFINMVKFFGYLFLLWFWFLSKSDFGV